MALLALATASVLNRPRLHAALLGIGVFGASLFYGDAVVMLAISVLSAVEGLEVADLCLQALRRADLAGIIIAPSLSRSRGRASSECCSARLLMWFASLGIVAPWNIAEVPTILQAVDPVDVSRFAT